MRSSLLGYELAVLLYKAVAQGAQLRIPVRFERAGAVTRWLGRRDRTEKKFRFRKLASIRPVCHPQRGDECHAFAALRENQKTQDRIARHPEVRQVHAVVKITET